MKIVLILSIVCGLCFATFAGEHRYQVAGFDKDAVVEKFASNLKTAIIVKNHGAVASFISYPITVYLDGKEKHIIKTKKEFAALYERIFYSDFLKRIKSAKTEDMFARWSGVMLGERGEIWICAVVGRKTPVVLAINNKIWEKK